MNLFKIYNQYIYYFIIGIISFLTLIFLPMIGTELNAEFTIPNTTVGWIVFITSKLIVSVINVLLFHCFVLQAKINIKDNENFKKAADIIQNLKSDTTSYRVIPKSPKQFFRKEYSGKLLAIFVTSVGSTFALTQAILTFDYITFLTYLFVIILGIVFGILEMKKVEGYWIDEYYQYALYLKFKKEEEDKLTKNLEMSIEEGLLTYDRN